MTITTAAPHGYTEGGKRGTVVLSGLGFTCDIDNEAHLSITIQDIEMKAYQKSISIASTTNTTITLDVGKSPRNESYPHTFASATTGAVVSGGDYPHSFVGSGSSAIILGEYDHTFVSADPQGITVGGEYDHTFVSSGSTVSMERWWISTHLCQCRKQLLLLLVVITHILSNQTSIMVVLLQSILGAGPFLTPIDVSYIPSTGVLTLEFNQPHFLTTNDTIGIATGSLTFTCDMDEMQLNMTILDVEILFIIDQIFQLLVLSMQLRLL